jgi:hypothetical protein
MKTILRNVLIAFILILSMGSTLVLAQSPASEQPVDQSNIIFANCRLGKLVADDKVGLTQAQIDGTAPSNVTDAGKQGYLKGCIQDIIRFIIVIASLAAILKIAASGLAMLDPSGSKMSQKLSSKSTITNLVIGLFLLIVGWNLIPILNASFNNVDFLNIPGTDHCSLPSSNCTTIYSIQAGEVKEALKKYETVVKDKKIVMLQKQYDDTIADLKKYCENIGKDEKSDKYKEAYVKAGITKPENVKICTDGYEKKFNDAFAAGKKGASGDGSDITTILQAYTTRAAAYKQVAAKGNADADKKAAETSLIETCSDKFITEFEKISAPLTPEQTKALASCKKIRDPKTRPAELAEIAK